MGERRHALTETLAAESVYRASVERALQARLTRDDELEASITTASEGSSTDLSTHIADTTTHGISSFGATLVDDANAAAARTTLAAAGSGAVTASGLTMATSRLLGRTTASTGAIEEITVGAGLSLAAGALTNTASAGAPTDAQYVTLATNGSLSAERVLTAGHGIDLTDGGANGAITVDVDETELDLTASNIIEGFGIVVLARSSSTQTVTNTATITDLLAYTIPANTLAADRAIRVTMGGTYLNNSGLSRIFTIGVTLGGTTLYEAPSAGNGASTLLTCWRCELLISCASSTSVSLSGYFWQSPTNTVTTGLGALNNIPRVYQVINSATGKVTVAALTSDRLLSFNFNHPTNTATQTLEREFHSVELMP